METGYCSFCDRTRNLRREERQLGALIRTVVACESCHRVLSSTIGVAGAETTPTEAAAEVEPRPAPATPAAELEVTPAPVTQAAAPKAKPAGAKTKAPANRNRPTK